MKGEGAPGAQCSRGFIVRRGKEHLVLTVHMCVHCTKGEGAPGAHCSHACSFPRINKHLHYMSWLILPCGRYLLPTMLCVNNEVLTFSSLLAKHQHVSPVQLNNNRQVNGTIVTLKVTDCLE